MHFYIIPSPIGNLDDMTLRSLKVLGKVDFVVVEKKDSVKKILNRYELNIKKIISYTDKSNEKDREEIKDMILDGKSGGLMSDAGMPLISDPGYKLINTMIESNIEIIPLPGPTSLISALVASGLPTNNFSFKGFLPRKRQEIINTLSNSQKLKTTLIFFESPKRILTTLELLNSNFGKKVKVCVAKEISKIHENFLRGSPDEVLNQLYSDQAMQKGEFVLLLSFLEEDPNLKLADDIFEYLNNSLSIGEISKVASKITGANKNLLYERFLSFSKKS